MKSIRIQPVHFMVTWPLCLAHLACHRIEYTYRTLQQTWRKGYGITVSAAIQMQKMKCVPIQLEMTRVACEVRKRTRIARAFRHKFCMTTLRMVVNIELRNCRINSFQRKTLSSWECHELYQSRLNRKQFRYADHCKSYPAWNWHWQGRIRKEWAQTR